MRRTITRFPTTPFRNSVGDPLLIVGGGGGRGGESPGGGGVLSSITAVEARKAPYVNSDNFPFSHSGEVLGNFSASSCHLILNF